MKYFYGLLCVLGIALPYSFFLSWLLDHGLDLELLIAEASSTRIGALAWMDVVVTAVALVGFILVEGRRRGMTNLWVPVIGTFSVGPSLGLPLFLLMREARSERPLGRSG
jgi:hypothetical protein